MPNNQRPTTRFFSLVALAMVLAATRALGQSGALADAGESGVRIVREWNAVVGESMSAELLPPTVAARVLAYMNVAAYEAGRRAAPDRPSMHGRLRDLPAMPEPDSACAVDWRVAAMAASKVVAKASLFRVVLIDSLYDAQLERLVGGGLNWPVRECSERYGARVGSIVVEWMRGDGYARMLGRVEYDPPRRAGAWEPAPPHFDRPQDPLWGTLRLMVLDSAAAPTRRATSAARLARPSPLAFSQDTTSAFMREAKEVADTTQLMGPERFQTAMYWYNLPARAPGKGEEAPRPLARLSAPTRWLGIAGERAERGGRSMADLLHATMVASVAMHETMIVTWAEKYRVNLLRPITAINGLIVRGWVPPLPTPPSPEYPAELAAVAGAASEAAIATIGDGPFVDSTEVALGFGGRAFDSLRQAAAEAALSGFFGGVQYRSSCGAGLEIGRAVAEAVVRRLVDAPRAPETPAPGARTAPRKKGRRH